MPTLTHFELHALTLYATRGPDEGWLETYEDDDEDDEDDEDTDEAGDD